MTVRKLKKPLIFALALLPVAAAGSYFAMLMSLSSVEPAIMDEAIKQAGSKELIIIISVAESVLIALACGFFGFILSEKTGLLRPFEFKKTAVIRTLIVSLISGAVLSLDAWTFARWIPGLSYETAGTFDPVTWAASALYGGVIEEVMMRLFFMSLLSFLGWKLFFRKIRSVPFGVFIGANIIAAAAFAAEHLPATAQAFGTLTPMLIFRCFLLNGAFGLVFGRLYRRYGIQYAILSHILCHLISRTVWLLAF